MEKTTVSDPKKGPDKPITYTLEGEPYETAEKVLTPRQILSNGEFDVETHYLTLLRGNSGERESYQNRLDEEIHMHPNMRFLAIFTGATPVS